MGHWLLFLAFLPCLGFAQQEATNPGSTALEFTVLFEADASETTCYRIPALATTPNGTLLAAIDQRVPSCADLRENPNINIVLRRSHDDGKTWSEQMTIVDFPTGKSASDPSFIVDRETRTIFLLYNYMDLGEDKGRYYFHLMSSDDNGLHWRGPIDITDQVKRPEWDRDFVFITSGRGIQTKSGRLLHTLVHVQRGVFVFGSDDHGQSWYLEETGLKPGDESKLVELANGGLMVNSRVNGSGIRFEHVQNPLDGSWSSRPRPELIDPGCNASLLRYSSFPSGEGRNELLFVNAKSRNSRENLTVRLSHDEGASWTPGKSIYPGSAAYSSATVLSNGDIGVLFETDDYQRNVFTRFPIHWITEGKDGEGPRK